jgi:hypothetical protein
MSLQEDGGIEHLPSQLPNQFGHLPQPDAISCRDGVKGSNPPPIPPKIRDTNREAPHQCAPPVPYRFLEAIPVYRGTLRAEGKYLWSIPVHFIDDESFSHEADLYLPKIDHVRSHEHISAPFYSSKKHSNEASHRNGSTCQYHESDQTQKIPYEKYHNFGDPTLLSPSKAREVDSGNNVIRTSSPNVKPTFEVRETEIEGCSSQNHVLGKTLRDHSLRDQSDNDNGFKARETSLPAHSAAVRSININDNHHSTLVQEPQSPEEYAFGTEEHERKSLHRNPHSLSDLSRAHSHIDRISNSQESVISSEPSLLYSFRDPPHSSVPSSKIKVATQPRFGTKELENAKAKDGGNPKQSTRDRLKESHDANASKPRSSSRSIIVPTVRGWSTSLRNSSASLNAESRIDSSQSHKSRKLSQSHKAQYHEDKDCDDNDWHSWDSRHLRTTQRRRRQRRKSPTSESRLRTKHREHYDNQKPEYGRKEGELVISDAMDPQGFSEKSLFETERSFDVNSQAIGTRNFRKACLFPAHSTDHISNKATLEDESILNSACYDEARHRRRQERDSRPLDFISSSEISDPRLEDAYSHSASTGKMCYQRQRNNRAIESPVNGKSRDKGISGEEVHDTSDSVTTYATNYCQDKSTKGMPSAVYSSKDQDDGDRDILNTHGYEAIFPVVDAAKYYRDDWAGEEPIHVLVKEERSLDPQRRGPGQVIGMNGSEISHICKISGMRHTYLQSLILLTNFKAFGSKLPEAPAPPSPFEAEPTASHSSMNFEVHRRVHSAVYKSNEFRAPSTIWEGSECAESAFGLTSNDIREGNIPIKSEGRRESG